jgi:trimeric autotransporter adhesin
VTTPNLTFAPSTVTIQAGQSVTWEFSGAVHNVTFFTTVSPGFDIPDQPPGSVIPRTFPTPGVYTYECTRHANMTGTVIVQSGQTQVFTSVSVAPATTSLVVGGTVPIIATPLDQSGVPMTGLPAASFSTSSAAIATVSPAGLVTATGAGTANITASITSGATTQSATATVLVSAAPAGGVTVSTTNNNTFSPGAVAIAAGGTVTWQFGNGTHNVTWNAGSPQPPGGNIPDQSAGTQSRTFSSAGNYTYQCTRHNGMTGTVTVSGGGGAPVYTSLDLQPLSPSVAVGATVQLVATPLDQNGTVMPALPAATFASSDATVVIVSTTGLVTGVSPGTVTVTASLTANGATHTAVSTVIVTSGPATIVTTPGLFFNPDDVRVPPGTTVTWQISGATHNITFETIAPPGGNAGATAPGNSVSRTFTQRGDYKYFCSIHGFKGEVRVQ